MSGYYVEWCEIWGSGEERDVHLLWATVTGQEVTMMERSSWETRYYELKVTDRHKAIVNFAVSFASEAMRQSAAGELETDIRLPADVEVVLGQRLRISVSPPEKLPEAA